MVWPPDRLDSARVPVASGFSAGFGGKGWLRSKLPAPYFGNFNNARCRR
jgi:hypothetical protein